MTAASLPFPLLFRPIFSIWSIYLLLGGKSIPNTDFWLSSHLWGFIHSFKENKREMETFLTWTILMLLIIFVGWVPFRHLRGDMEWQWCSKFLQAPRKIVGSALNWHQAGLTHPVDLSLCLKSLPKRQTEKDSWKPYLGILQKYFFQWFILQMRKLKPRNAKS